MADRCENCDRVKATDADDARHDADECKVAVAQHWCNDLCWAEWGGDCEPVDWRQRALKAEALLACGPTGDFPRGQLDEADEGGIDMGIEADVQAGVVRLNFGKPVAWIGLDATAARELAAHIVAKADELDGEKSLVIGTSGEAH